MLLLFVLSYNLRIMRIICAIPRMNDELCEFRVDRSMLNVETGWVTRLPRPPRRQPAQLWVDEHSSSASVFENRSWVDALADMTIRSKSRRSTPFEGNQEVSSFRIFVTWILSQYSEYTLKYMYS